jgi:hypothetical protein
VARARAGVGGWCEARRRDVVTVRIVRAAVPGLGERRFWVWAIPCRAGPVRWPPREEVFPERPGIVFEQVDGDLARLSGAWRFLPEPGGPADASDASDVSGTPGTPGTPKSGGGSCEVTFELRFDLGVPLWNRVIDPVLARALTRAAEAVIVAALGEAEPTQEPVAVPDAERLVTAVAVNA